MSDTCDGRHMCEPSHYPSGAGESWTCPECGRRYTSFAVTPESVPVPASVRHLIPEDHWGWTSTP